MAVAIDSHFVVTVVSYMAGNYLHMWLLLAIVFEAVAISSGTVQFGCEVDDSDTARVCAQVYKALDSALISNGKNILVLRKMFFSSPVASVVLLKVNYTIDFNPNIFNVSCSSSRDNSTDGIFTTTTAWYEFVWTRSGVYEIIPAIVINLLQLQLPFFILRLYRDKFFTNPEVDAFLWDGSYELPSVTLHLTVDLKCPPTNDMLHNALEDFTVRVSCNSSIYS